MNWARQRNSWLAPLPLADREDYCGDREVGRVYSKTHASKGGRTYWSIMDKWLVWAKLEEQE